MLKKLASKKFAQKKEARIRRQKRRGGGSWVRLGEHT